MLSGYFGGWLDLIVQRFIDMMQSLPLLVTALVMAASLGPSLRNTIIAIAIPLVPSIARIVRSNTLALKEMPFVEAARAIGISETWIAIRHVLPNTLAPLIVLATAQFGSAILVEASLSFLGLGVPEPYPSWGRMLSESAAEYMRTAPWLVIFPGIAISLVVFGANLLGDALRDMLDPRLRTLMQIAMSGSHRPASRATRPASMACQGAEPVLDGRMRSRPTSSPATARSRRSTACRLRSRAARRWRSSASPAAARA